MFFNQEQEPLNKRLRPELLAMEWQKKLKLPSKMLSVLDINQAQIPLAFNAINGKLLICKDDGLRMMAESVIISKVELDYLYQPKHKM